MRCAQRHIERLQCIHRLPDWLTKIDNPPFVIGGCLYRNSDAISVMTGISEALDPILRHQTGVIRVPHALIETLGTDVRSISVGGKVIVCVAGFSIECSVSPITAGCSWISFSMKWRYCPYRSWRLIERLHNGTLDSVTGSIPGLGATRGDFRPIAFFEIANALG